MVYREIPKKVADNPRYRNARKHTDRENARVEMNGAPGRVFTNIMQDDSQLFKQFTDNRDFPRLVGECGIPVDL